MVIMNGQANLTLEPGSGKQSWFRLPWAACNGATVWQIHLNPEVVSDITAHSDGGNIKLNLAGMVITHLSADTGGGNIQVILPNSTANLTATVKTGAGNVTVELPGGVAARVQVAIGLGKAVIDPRLSLIDKNTYQTPGFEDALVKVEIVASSGAGDVIVNRR
ncbi:MAG: cell wall-active antibiotics response protein [Anaerolineales bacterium]|nr:cell wall-active antibiotics response protein [Anaerolineales bacterium]